MEEALRENLVAFIKAHNTAVGAGACRLTAATTDEELINYTIKKISYDERVEYSYTGPVLSVLIHEMEIDFARTLINLGANLNTPDQDSNTPLHHALCLENVDLIRLIAGRGGDTIRVPYHRIDEDDAWYTFEMAGGIRNILFGDDAIPDGLDPDVENAIQGFLLYTPDPDTPE